MTKFCLFCGNELDFCVEAEDISKAREGDIYIYFDGDKYDPDGECLTDNDRCDLSEYDDAWDEAQNYYQSAVSTLNQIL